MPAMDRKSRQELLKKLRSDAARIAARYDLRYDSIQAEDPRVKRRYGSCDGDGRIWIRLTHVRTKEPLKYSSLIDTLCHELAHLRYFHHGPAFKAFYLYLLDWAREQGIYRPTPRKVKGAAESADGGGQAPQDVAAARGESREPVTAAQLAVALRGREPVSAAAVAVAAAPRRKRPRRRGRPSPGAEQLQLL